MLLGRSHGLKLYHEPLHRSPSSLNPVACPYKLHDFAILLASGAGSWLKVLYQDLALA